MTEMSSDWWLAEGNLQLPKREIGDYVESQGFLVPRRFDTLDETLEVVRVGGEIILRSEHPDDYDGPSGLMDSYRLGPDTFVDCQDVFERYGDFDIDEQVDLSTKRGAVTAPKRSKGPGYRQMEDVILGTSTETATDVTIERLKVLTREWRPVRRYAELTGRSVAELIQDMQYSFWEYTPGKNVTVVADDAIDGRYHVMTSTRGDDERISYGWQTTDGNGRALFEPESPELMDQQATKSAIDTYETIRNLPRFASEHCPMMELQIDRDGRVWFLQYHRARDFRAAGSILNAADFSPKEGWKQVEAVRGALDSPTTLRMALSYPHDYGASGRRPLPETEEASAEGHWDLALTEVLSRRRVAFVGDESRDWLYSNLVVSHAPRSRWFKPVVAVTRFDRGLQELVPPALHEGVKRRARSGLVARVAIDLAADGHTGYIRLNSEEEQPY
jgi:hypothetical protein